MLHHAEKPKTITRRKPDRCLHKLQRGKLYVVVSCPLDADGQRIFNRDAAFNQPSVKAGLREGVWPEGLVFQHGTQHFTVRGRALVGEGQ